MPGRRDRRLVVRHESPYRRRIYALLALLVVMGGVTAAYLLGERRGGYLRFVSATTITRLNRTVADEARKNATLEIRKAFLEHALALANQSARAVQKTLILQQRQAGELRQKLVFYQGILTPGTDAAPVHIAGLQVLATGNRREYRFQIVLVRAREDKSAAPLRGVWRLDLSGTRNGRSVKLGLARLGGGGDGKMHFTLRYFSNLAGTLRLPRGFEPHTVTIRIDLQGGGRTSGTYSWHVFRS